MKMTVGLFLNKVLDNDHTITIYDNGVGVVNMTSSKKDIVEMKSSVANATVWDFDIKKNHITIWAE